MKGGTERTEILRRSVRVSLSAAAGFYPFLYGLDDPVVALYALFAPISLGLLSSIPGSGRQRAEVMLKALPVGLVLVTLGTVLAVQTWAAVVGMLVVGFLLAFAAIAGPRPAGAAPGLQLFYILACFPPYEPETLWLRLAGLTYGVVVLALCELFLLPQPPGPTYRETLAHALVTAGDTIVGRGGHLSPTELRDAGARLRLSDAPPAERPAGPGRAARGLAQAGSATRRLLEQLAHLTESGELRALVRDGTGAAADPDADVGGKDGGDRCDVASGSLLPQVATLCHETAAALRTGRATPGSQRMKAAIDGFQQLRMRQVTESASEVPPVPVLRRQAALLAVAESVRVLEISVGVALDGRRTPPIEPRELFWYAQSSTPCLWSRRIIGNMTLRSVQFQNATRIAVALAAARLVAGSLDLTHGFWVLLAVLTLSRTTVGETWAAIRKAVAGNLVGAVAAGALLIGLGQHTEAYAALLAPGMLIAFALGPLLGIAWAQGLFTLVVATAFAQIAPATWHIAAARIVDVVTGSAIGLLCAMLAWPSGARREVLRTMAGLLRECGPLIKGTVATLTAVPPGSAPAPPTLPTLHRLRLAESAYAQYRSEPRGGTPAHADWHAVLIAANHILLGAQWLPRVDLPARALPADAADQARAGARALANTTDRLAALCAGDLSEWERGGPSAAEPGAVVSPLDAARSTGSSGPEADEAQPPPQRPDEDPFTSSRPRPALPAPDETRPAPPQADRTPMPALVDLDVWLRSVTAQLNRIEDDLPETVRQAERRTTAVGVPGSAARPGGDRRQGAR
ncbi:FUSC family protein [Streptomyces sp. NPDC086077]|uniref:FUSC family protein n=1 Tax=Streptomyces sp. NPDC086077 TaxID=3154862 RepID=UPI003426FAC7